MNRCGSISRAAQQSNVGAVQRKSSGHRSGQVLVWLLHQYESWSNWELMGGGVNFNRGL